MDVRLRRSESIFGGSSKVATRFTNDDLMEAILELHGATAHGFARVDVRLTSVETKLTLVAGEVSGLQRWRNHVDSRLSALEARG